MKKLLLYLITAILFATLINAAPALNINYTVNGTIIQNYGFVTIPCKMTTGALWNYNLSIWVNKYVNSNIRSWEAVYNFTHVNTSLFNNESIYVYRPQNNINYKMNVGCRVDNGGSDYTWAYNQTVFVNNALIGGAPDIRVIQPFDNTVSSSATVAFNATVIDSGQVAPLFYLSDINGNTLYLNASRGLANSVNKWIIDFNFSKTLGNGTYKWYMAVMDNDSNIIKTPIFTITVHTVYTQNRTGLSIIPRAGTCTGVFDVQANYSIQPHGVKIDFNATSLSGRATQAPNVAKDLSIAALSSTKWQATGAVTLEEEQEYTYEVNVTDLAGNKNVTSGTFYSGTYLCAGAWRALPVLQTKILGSLGNETRASSIAYYNSTGKAWVQYVTGLNANANLAPEQGHAVWAYMDTSNMYSSNEGRAKNVTMNVTNIYNITFVTIDNWQTINKFATDLCRNATSAGSAMGSNCTLNISSISYMNNSERRYYTYAINSSNGNATIMRQASAAWVIMSSSTNAPTFVYWRR
jgi:hypothetical protein